MTFWKAIKEVLTKAKRPMTAREIFDEAVNNGLITSNGKTPLATLIAILYKKSTLDPRLERLYEAGPTRAKQGSVRWRFRRRSRAPQSTASK